MATTVQKVSHPRAFLPSMESAATQRARNASIPFSELRGLRYLTQGGQCQIFTGRLDGRLVVVKTFRPDVPFNGALNLLKRERAVVEKLDHSNVVGYCGSGNYMKNGCARPFLVFECLEGGSLSQKLTAARALVRKNGGRINFKQHLNRALGYALDIAKGMAYIHSQGMIHRDLKPCNLAFNHQGVLKVLDFGLTKDVAEQVDEQNARVPRRMSMTDLTGSVGTLRYMSRECRKHQLYDSSTDVYSFSVILWEMLTLRRPFHGMSASTFDEKVTEGGMKLCLYPEWPQELQILMQRCWDDNQFSRPTFKEIIPILQGLISSSQ